VFDARDDFQNIEKEAVTYDFSTEVRETKKSNLEKIACKFCADN
jgi:hypothetical protein